MRPKHVSESWVAESQTVSFSGPGAETEFASPGSLQVILMLPAGAPHFVCKRDGVL